MNSEKLRNKCSAFEINKIALRFNRNYSSFIINYSLVSTSLKPFYHKKIRAEFYTCSPDDTFMWLTDVKLNFTLKTPLKV